MPTTIETLIPELKDYAQCFEAAKRAVRELVAGLSEDKLQWCPEPGRLFFSISVPS
jgi:hypothetical protein